MFIVHWLATNKWGAYLLLIIYVCLNVLTLNLSTLCAIELYTSILVSFQFSEIHILK